MGDVVPRFLGSLLADDTVDLINRNFGNPPPFRRSSQYCDSHIPYRW